MQPIHIALSQMGDFRCEGQTVYSGEMIYSQSLAYEEGILSPSISTRYVRFYIDGYYGMGADLINSKSISMFHSKLVTGLG